jgi:ankyrin repeat protein
MFFLVLFILAFRLSFAEPEVKDLNLSFDDFRVVIEEEKQPKAQKPIQAKNNLEEFFDKNTERLKRLELLKKQDENNLKLKIRRPQNLELPDPFFYDAIYLQKQKFIASAFIYNDKTNKDNNYIPKFLQYNSSKDLFYFAKRRPDREKFYAVYNASREDKSFDINVKDEFGNTLLLTALHYGNFEIFFFLLARGADVNLCNNKGVCPIQLAVYEGGDEIVKALCMRNVDIKVKDKNNFTALEYAIYNRNYQTSFTLLERYLSYPRDNTERKALIDLAESTGMEQFALKMREIFQI